MNKKFGGSRLAWGGGGLSCQIAFVASYLRENEAENLQNGDVHFAQIPDLGWDILNELKQSNNTENESRARY